MEYIRKVKRFENKLSGKLEVRSWKYEVLIGKWLTKHMLAEKKEKKVMQEDGIKAGS